MVIRRNMSALAWAFLLCEILLGSASLVHAATLYQVGNSLTIDSKPSGIVALAQLAGIELSTEATTMGNSTLSEIWSLPNNLASGDWDQVTLQLFNKGATTLASDLIWFDNYRDRTLQNPNNSATKFYVHAPWTTRFNWAKWDDPVVDSPSQPTKHSLAYSELLVNKLNEQTPDTYYLIPAGEVLAEIRNRIAGEGIPGLTSITNLYRDHTHMNDLGRFVAASTFFATLYKQDPSLLGIPRDVSGWTESAVPEVLGHQLQEIVWEVVTTQVLTGVYPVGDFNEDTLVDSADYQLWKDQFGFQTTLTADANEDGVVDFSDAQLWLAATVNTQGDYDGDGQFTETDLDIWQAAYASNSSVADGNEDGVVDAADYTVWRDAKGLFESTDFNEDGIVDSADFDVWKHEEGWKTVLEADANRDGVVNAADYTVWRDNFDAASTTSSTSTVPEPSVLLLLVSGLFAASAFRRVPLL